MSTTENAHERNEQQEDHNNNSNDGNVPLVNHLYLERIYPMLPVESHFETYLDVEKDQLYISCRSVIMNIAISSNVNDIIENTLNAIDMITKDHRIISSKISTGSIHSILVLLRLLCDVVEYYWDHLESSTVPKMKSYEVYKTNQNKSNSDNSDIYIDVQNKIFANSAIGYSIVEPGFHETSPVPLKKHIANRLMETCLKLRSHVRNLKVMKNMCSHLFSTSNNTIFQKILPEYQSFLRKRTDHKILAMIDIALGRLLRFSSATNPEQYLTFINKNLKEPLTMNPSSSSDMKYVQNVELIGYVYLDEKIISRYLDLVTFLNNMKRPVFSHLVLYFASSTLLFWIMARPAEYLQTYQKLKSYNLTKQDQTMRALSTSVNNLFDDVYSSFNVSNMLTATHNLSSIPLTRASDTSYNNNNNTSATVPTSSASSTSTSTSAYATSSLLSTRNTSNHIPIVSPSSASASVSSSSTSSSSTSLNSVEQDKLRRPDTLKKRRSSSSNSGNITPLSKSGQSPIISNTPTITALSLLNSPKHSSTDINQYFQSRIPSNNNNNNNNYDTYNSGSRVTLNNLASVNESRREISNSNYNSSNPSISSSLNGGANESIYSRSTSATGSGSASSNSLVNDMSHIHALNTMEDTKDITQTDVIHVENILDLYNHFSDNESLPHTAVLNFLTTLLMLDTEVFTEINTQSFKHIEEIKSKDKISSSTKEDESAPHIDRDRNLHMKHFTSGLRRLKALQLSRKKTIKYVDLIIKNITEVTPSSELAQFDSIMSIISLYSLSASVAKYKPNLPAVLFSKRITQILGINLHIGDGWDKRISTNNILQDCLQRNAFSYFQLQVTYITAALQLENDKFMKSLNMQKCLDTQNLQLINLYTESFRVFFSLPLPEPVKKDIAYKTSSFFKSSFRLGSEATLKNISTLDDDITEIATAILNGTILDKNGMRIKRNALNGKTKYPSNVPSDESLLQAFESAVDIDDGGIEINWSPNSMHRSASSSINTANDSSSVLTSSTGQIISPRARRAAFPNALNRSKSPLSMYTNENVSDTNNFTSMGDSSKTPSISSQLMTSTTSTPLQRNVKPLVKQTLGRLRRYSEESNGPNMKLSTSQVNLAAQDVDIKTTTNFLYGKQITINILNTFKRMTSYFILPHDKNPNLDWVAEDFHNIIKPVFVSVLEADEALHSSAQLFMNVLLEYINEYGSNKSAMTIKGYLLICSHTASLFAVELLNLNLSNKQRAILLDILIKYLKLRSSLMKSSQGAGVEAAAIEVQTSTFPLLYGTVGRALLISFYCNDPKVQKLIIAGNIEFHKLIENYKEHYPDALNDECTLSDFILKDNAFATSGATAFQRRVRNAILMLRSKPDAIILDCVDKMFKKWYHYTKSDKKTNRKKLWEFRNLAGILSAVSGVFLRTISGNSISATVADELDSSYINYDEVVATLRNDFSYFISKQCEWLNNVDLLTRENARDIISLELHPYSLNVLFNHLRNHINQITNVDLCAKQNEMSFVLLEQIIIIIRTILRREDIGDIMIVYSTNIIDVIDRLIVVVKNMDPNAPKYYKSVIHMSKMFKAIQTSEEALAIKHHYCLKNKWLKLVISWFRMSIQKKYDLENLARPHREMNLETRDMDYLYIDTAIESSKAIAYLTENLPLEVLWSGSADEVNRSKVVFFGKYFNVLLKGLKKSMDLQDCPVTVKHKMTLLNENVILALTNISKANTEVSVQFTLPMGYSYNKNIKIAFLNVFTNILSRYPIDNRKLEEERLHTIDSMLLYTIQHSELAIYSSRSCPVNDIDQYTAVLVNAFETRNASHIIISELIKDEIKNSTRPSDILRRNSCATRSLALLAKDKGYHYLINILRMTLQNIMDENKSVEIEKINSDDPEATEKIDLFVRYFASIIDVIVNSIGDMPKEFFYISQSIYIEAQKRFPGYGLVAVGSFIFLRLICPAIVSPETENIIGVPSVHQKRLLLSLAKGIQGLANKSDYLIKWPILKSKMEFFEECSKKMFCFLQDVCNPEREIDIKVRMNGDPIPFDYGFFHQYIYRDGINVRRSILSNIKLTDNIPFLSKTLLMFDEALGRLGEPKFEYKNEIPENIKELGPEYPKLYEFMSRFAFKKYKQIGSDKTFVRELLASDGVPILTVSMAKLLEFGVELETVVFKLIQLYTRIWSSKHYLLFDCTEYEEASFDFTKFVIIMNNIFPEFVPENCACIYIINVNDDFLKQWEQIFDQNNVYLAHKVPHEFRNTNSDGDLLKYLKIDCEGLQVMDDVRISLHNIMMYDENNNRLSPVSMKLGNQYFQILHETPKKFKLVQLNEIVDVKINEVYKVADVVLTDVSSITGVTGEFTINLTSGKRLIFCSTKFLEIMKMFEYAKSREEFEYVPDETIVAPIDVQDIAQHSDERNDMIGHLLLVTIVGLFTPDDVVKSHSYNLLAAAERAFKLNLGSHFHKTPAVYIPSNATIFLSNMAKSLATYHPEITNHCWKYILEGIENDYIPKKYIPQVISFLSYWVDNLYGYVYLGDDENGDENTSKIIRSLIQLSLSEPAFTSLYLNEIWFPLITDGRLAKLIVTEIMGHCLERDSENKDWTRITDLLTGFPTVGLATEVVERLLDTVKHTLPTLKFDTTNQSWAELKILVHITAFLFFESTLLVQMFLPDVLFVISILIDIGPIELRTLIFELLMNVCNSLSINSILPSEKKQQLDDITSDFATYKLKYIFGFSQYKGDILPSFSTGSFSIKFNILDSFVTKILLLMDGPAPYETYKWRSKYKKYLSELVFTSNPFLSARAMMILGIAGKTYTSTKLLNNLLVRTMWVTSEPIVNTDNVFMVLSHAFAYSKIVQGLDPSFPLLMKLFWLSMCLIYTDHPSIFESGLIFMSNCASRLYEYHFANGSEMKTLVKELLDAREFAEPFLCQIEKAYNVTWSEDNFVSIIVAFISRGLSIPSIRANATECLIGLFKNAYHEYQLFSDAVQFKSYMFLLFLTVDADQFGNILKSAGYDGGMVVINEQCKIPTIIEEWLCSDTSQSNDALYQGAMIFKNKNIDEPTKFKLLLVMQLLLDREPICLFRFYGAVNTEMRRITSLEHHPKWIPIIFQIMGEVVRYSQFHNFNQCNTTSIDRIKDTGLDIILHSQLVERNQDELKEKFVQDLDFILTSKKAITMLIARLACPT